MINNKKIVQGGEYNILAVVVDRLIGLSISILKRVCRTKLRVKSFGPKLQQHPGRIIHDRPR